MAKWEENSNRVGWKLIWDPFIEVKMIPKTQIIN